MTGGTLASLNYQVFRFFLPYWDAQPSVDWWCFSLVVLASVMGLLLDTGFRRIVRFLQVGALSVFPLGLYIWFGDRGEFFDQASKTFSFVTNEWLLVLSGLLLCISTLVLHDYPSHIPSKPEGCP